MDEQTKKEATQNQSSNSTQNSEAGTTPTTLFEQTRQERERTEKLLQDLKAENDRREKLMSEALLSGTAGAGIPRPQMTEEQIKKQAALEFWKGTAIADAIAKENG